VFGLNSYGQTFAAIICATIPVGILEASGTQNNYVLAFWLTCFAYYVLQLNRNGLSHPVWFYTLGAGASLGLALLTKATAYIFALPFLVWLIVSQLRFPRSGAWRCVPIIAITALIINIPYFQRNTDLYGSPVVTTERSSLGEYRFANEVFTIPSFVSNIIRNIGSHLGTPIDQVNNLTERSIRGMHALLGVDINDRRTTFTRDDFHIYRPRGSEDRDGNLVHTVLVIVVMMLLVSSKRLRSIDSLGAYCICIVSGFLLFSALAKWQLPASRLQLPLFVLWAAPMALILLRFINRRHASLLAVVLIAGAVPLLLFNAYRPLVGRIARTGVSTEASIFTTSRIDQYFQERGGVRLAYIGAGEFIESTGCRRIGLVLQDLELLPSIEEWNDRREFYDDSFEYPIWVLLGKTTDNDTLRLRHIDVTNLSRVKQSVYPIEDFTPCAIVSLIDNESGRWRADPAAYELAWSTPPITVWMARYGDR